MPARGQRETKESHSGVEVHDWSSRHVGRHDPHQPFQQESVALKEGSRVPGHRDSGRSPGRSCPHVVTDDRRSTQHHGAPAIGTLRGEPSQPVRKDREDGRLGFEYGGTATEPEGRSTRNSLISSGAG